MVLRDIEFRGKLNNGEWAYGNLEVKTDKVCIITPDDTPLGKYGQVIPETVGQYTGLTDKNGTKIFEGDILAIGENGKRYQTVSVSFKDGAFRVSHYAINLLESRNIESEVIGNIHDNPELLKGGEDNA